MRPIYLLLTFITALSLSTTRAQDVVNFNFIIGTNNTVSFINTSVLSGNADRKAYWYFGDGTYLSTTALANTEHHYSNAGVYNVCLKIYKYTNDHDSVVSADTCKTLTLQALLTDSCKAGFEDGIASNTALIKIFVAQPWHNNNKKPEDICWNFGDGHDTCIHYNPSLSNNYALYHNYAQAGAYNVCVTIKYQGGCSSHYCREVKTGETATCKIEYRTETPNDFPLVKYFIAQPVNSQGKKPLRICWKFGDEKDTCVQYTTAAGQNYVVKHAYAHGGQYQVCVSVLFDGGCEAHYCKAETISEPSTHPDTCFVNVNEVVATVSQLARKFYAGLTQHKVPLKICWQFGDGRDSCVYISNPPTDKQLMMVHEYPAPGRYELCAKVWYDGGCIAQKCRIVEITAPHTDICGGYITDSLIAIRAVLFKGFSISNANDHVISWRWVFGDGSSADGKEVKHEFVKGGTYPVCLFIKTDMNCETRICKTITVHGGDGEAQLQLSPNPAANTLHIVFRSTLQEEVTVRIYNANGSLLKTYTRNAVTGINTWDVDVNTLPAGIYSLIVQSPHQLANAIFFKQ
jgi:PKD repeat protein